LHFGYARGKHDGREQRTIVHAETFAKVMDGIFFCKFYIPFRTATDTTRAGKNVEDASQTTDSGYAWTAKASGAIANTSAERGRIWFWRSVHERRHHCLYWAFCFNFYFTRVILSTEYRAKQ